MLLAQAELIGIPVMSLQTGGELAVTSMAIIDPDNLQIVAYELGGSKLDVEPAFVKIEDLRELSDIGFIVDSSDEIVGLDDIVVAKKLYTQPLELVGMKVIDNHNAKLGKVEQAIMNTDTFEIEQLQVRQPFFKSLSDTNLLIHRRQIIDVTTDTIVVRAPSVDAKEPAKLAKQPLINPFRHAAPTRPQSVKSDRHEERA